MFPLEVITFAVSTLIGGFLKLKTKQMESEEKRNEMIIRRLGGLEESRERAMRIVGGPWVRRLIVIVCLTTVFIAPVVHPYLQKLIGTDVTVCYAYTEAAGRFLGVFGSGYEKLKYIEVGGIVILPIHTHMTSLIAGFYFGSGAVK